MPLDNLHLPNDFDFHETPKKPNDSHTLRDRLFPAQVDRRSVAYRNCRPGGPFWGHCVITNPALTRAGLEELLALRAASNLLHDHAKRLVAVCAAF